MRQLVHKLSRAEKRGEGCHLTPEMVAWLCAEDTAMRRRIQEFRKRQNYHEKVQRKVPSTVTTKMVEEMRTLYRVGYTYREIAAKMDLSISTVRKYQSEVVFKIEKSRERERYEREKQNPEWVEKRRQNARDYVNRTTANVG